jgi:hypothetical protein
MKNQIEGGRPENGGGDEDGEAEDCNEDEGDSAHAGLFTKLLPKLRAKLLRSDTLRVQRLQSLHAHFSALQGSNTLRGSSSGRERGDGRDVTGDGGAPDRLLVEVWVGTMRRVDDQLDAIGFDQIHRVGGGLP